MLLSDFTWWQFATVATILTVIWYTGVFLLFFRDEIKESLGLKPREFKNSNAVPPSRHEEDEDVMGETKAPEGVTESYDIGFVPTSKEERLGTVPDFLKEISEILDIVSRENGSKEDLTGMLEELGQVYFDITKAENWDSLVVHIKDSSPFPLTEEEINSLFR